MFIVRLIKGFLFWLIFTALCVALVLETMRSLAHRSRRDDLYAYWRDDMRDALEEARLFVSTTLESARRKLRKMVPERPPT